MSVCLSICLSGHCPENFPGTARTDKLSAGVSYIWADTDTEKKRERERRGQEQSPLWLQWSSKSAIKNVILLLLLQEEVMLRIALNL
jgi:hypothetical protein